MGQRLEEIRAAGADLVGIAVTAIYSQQAFARHLDLDFMLLSDHGGATARAYGVEYDEWKGHIGLAKRSIFVVDTSGTIAYRWATDDASVQPDLDALLVELRGLSAD